MSRLNPKSPVPRRRRSRNRGDGSYWALVRTRIGQEAYARRNCEKQGHEVFVPRWCPTGRGKIVALFPGYIFVRIVGPFTHLRSTYGVIDVVGMSSTRGVPTPVPPAEIKALRKFEDDEGIIRPPSQRALKPGERVQFTTTAFKNHVAVYIGASDGDRIELLLSLLGHSVRYTTKRSTVVPVNA